MSVVGMVMTTEEAEAMMDEGAEATMGEGGEATMGEGVEAMMCEGAEAMMGEGGEAEEGMALVAGMSGLTTGVTPAMETAIQREAMAGEGQMNGELTSHGGSVEGEH